MKSNPPLPSSSVFSDRSRGGSVEEQLLGLLDSASDLIQCADASGRLVFVNRTWCDVLGYDQDAATELTLAEVVHPRARAEFDGRMRELLRVGESRELQIETVFRAADGREIQLEGSIGAKFDHGRLHCLRTTLRDVSWRNQVRSRLRKSERRYRDLLEGLHEVVFQTDEAGRFTFLNQAWERITGRAVLESLGYRLIDFTHEADREMLASSLEISRDSAAGTTVRQLRMRRADGGVCWMHLEVQMRRSEQGMALGFHGSLTDFTERHRAEQRVQQQVLAMNSAADGIALLDAAGCYTHLNKAHVEMFGYTDAEQLLGGGWQVLYDASEVSRLERDVFPELVGHGSWTGMARATRLDGSTFPEELTLTLLPDGGLICICRDVTEREKSAQALRESEMRWQLAVDGIRDGVWDWDITADVVYMSKRWREQLPVSDQDLRQARATWQRLVHPDDWEEMNGVLEAHFRRETDVFQCEHRIKVVGGDYQWIMARAKAVFDDNGQPVRVVGTITDITARKEAERHMLENLGREKELAEMRQHFVHMASHELRTPLATVSLGLEFLLSNWEKIPPENRIKSLRSAFTGVSELRAILDDLLLLGKADDGKIRCRRQDLNLQALLCKICQSVGDVDKHRHPLKLAGVDPEERIAVDPLLVSHVLSNLLSNACKYSDVNLPVTVGFRRERESLVFTVTDVGMGIPAEDQSRLFGFFVRAGNVNGIPGTGLGLLVVKYCLEAHGGCIGFESEEGKGTRFEVFIPIQTKETSA